MNNKNYVGIDLGKRTLEAVNVQEGEKNKRFKCKTNDSGLSALFNWIKPTDIVALESCSLAITIARQLKAKVGCEVLILDPRRLVVIYQSLKKTDKEDSLKLAKLIQRIPKEELPLVTIPSQAEEEHRQLVIAAFTFLAYFGDCTRFKTTGQMCSYAGLVPKLDISGDTVRYGKVVKGCHHIKRIILQCSWAMIRSKCEGPLKEFYLRMFGKTGKKRAAVATARKMIAAFYTMIKKNELYKGTSSVFLKNKMRQYALA